MHAVNTDISFIHVRKQFSIKVSGYYECAIKLNRVLLTDLFGLLRTFSTLTDRKGINPHPGEDII